MKCSTRGHQGARWSERHRTRKHGGQDDASASWARESKEEVRGEAGFQHVGRLIEPLGLFLDVDSVLIINTAVRKFSRNSSRDGAHISER